MSGIISQLILALLAAVLPPVFAYILKQTPLVPIDYQTFFNLAVWLVSVVFGIKFSAKGLHLFILSRDYVANNSTKATAIRVQASLIAFVIFAISLTFTII